MADARQQAHFVAAQRDMLRLWRTNLGQEIWIDLNPDLMPSHVAAAKDLDGLPE